MIGAIIGVVPHHTAVHCPLILILILILILTHTCAGQSIEPSCYVPIIPMALVNGSDGIGTGKEMTCMRCKPWYLTWQSN